MELRHVRTFLVLSEELHFGRTARRMRVAQSAVSQTIRALEEHVGAELFSRASGGVRLTAAGEAFLAPARRAMAELAQGIGSARSSASGETGPLRLWFGPMSALTLLSRVLERFRREVPGVELVVQSGAAADQLAAIAEGRCDLGFFSPQKHPAGELATERVETAGLVAVLSPTHPCAGLPEVPLAALSGEPLLMVDPLGGPDGRARFLERCREASFVPGPLTEVGQLEVLLALVAAGVGVSFAPGWIGRLGARQVALVPVSPAVVVEIAAVWCPARLPAAGARFLETLRRERDG